MLLLIPLLPFLGFLINLAMGRRLSKATSGGVACAAMFGAFLAAAWSFWSLVQMPPDARGIVQQVAPWIESGSLSVPFTLRLDPLGAVMVLVVTGIGFLIHVYSTAYMHEERGSEYARYFSYLNLFAAFMLVLVLGASFPVMFVGWEGVGLCSYLLIGFWFTKQSASDAGKKAFIVNRVGDFGFLLGMFVVWSQFGSLDFQEVARQAGQLPPEATFGALSLATVLLFVGATGKSAQIPLYVWLPDAMEGPTPVSALIHAATMVTAGVYMIGRNAVLFSHAPETLAIVAGIGVATALDGRHHRPRAERHQARARVLDRVATRPDVRGHGRGRVRGGDLPPLHARLLQGPAVPRVGRRHPRPGRRAGHPADGRPEERAACHLLDVPDRVAGDLRRAPAVGVLQQGRDPLEGVLGRPRAGVDRGGRRVAPDGDLHVPARVPDLPRRAGERRLRCPRSRRESRRSPERSGRTRAVEGRRRHHDAPPAMAVVLVLLAVGSVLAGYVGIPAVLGGGNHIEHFLEPSFAAPGVESSGEHGAGPAEARREMVVGSEPKGEADRHRAESAKAGARPDGLFERHRAGGHRDRGVFLPAQAGGGRPARRRRSRACTACC